MSLCTSNPHSTTCIYKVLSVLSVVICCYRVFGNCMAQTTQHTRICSPFGTLGRTLEENLKAASANETITSQESAPHVTARNVDCLFSNEQLDIRKLQI